jgi:hypothetical protein
MKQNQVRALADGMACMLLSHAAHGVATRSLTGMGEITLRDGLIVAAAAAGARLSQAWIIDREILPEGWLDAAVDVMIHRKGNHGNLRLVGGIELKWWRRMDAANAANRRRDLIKDFVRAAALYPMVEDFSFVALLSTAVSWSSTVKTSGTDGPAMKKLRSHGSQHWNLKGLRECSAVKGTIRALNERVPIPNIFHTELMSNIMLAKPQNKVAAFARVWAVRKPQNTRTLNDGEIAGLLQ